MGFQFFLHNSVSVIMMTRINDLWAKKKKVSAGPAVQGGTAGCTVYLVRDLEL